MRLLRPIVVSALAVGTALALAGCLDAGFPGDTATPTAAPTASAPSPSAPTASAPEPTPTPTTAPSAPGAPVALDCSALLPIDVLYAIDPNLTLVPVAGDPAGGLAQEALAADGTVCQVTHATSGASAFLGVSAPGSAALDAQRASAGPASPLGATGLDAHGDENRLQVFHGDRRVTGECDAAFNPASLRVLLETALDHGA